MGILEHRPRGSDPRLAVSESCDYVESRFGIAIVE